MFPLKGQRISLVLLVAWAFLYGDIGMKLYCNFNLKSRIFVSTNKFYNFWASNLCIWIALTFSAGSGSWFIVTGIRQLVLKVFQISSFLVPSFLVISFVISWSHLPNRFPLWRQWTIFLRITVPVIWCPDVWRKILEGRWKSKTYL